jgi:glycosyltransferase involved in cell wall biosynthesis
VVVAGEGPLLEQFRRELHNLGLTERVHLLGRIRDVNRVIASSNLVLLTSTMEGFPNVLLEAQWLGCPVVAPNVGGIPEVVKNGETGILFERDQVVEASQACIRLLSNRLERERFSKAARDFVRKAYSLEQMLEGSTRVYDPSVTAQCRKSVSSLASASAVGSV